jgi:peroxiredoxin
MGSGAISSLAEVGSMSALLGTAHGRLLLGKLAVLVPILALAAVNRRSILPVLSDSGETDGRPAMRRLCAFVALVTHGIPALGVPEFETRLEEAPRWNVVNAIRALGAADGSRRIGPHVEKDRAWLAAPDFTISVGPLSPGALRDYRGQRMVLLVLYTLPGSRARMSELAQSYNVLSILGVEVIAVPTDASPESISALGSSPPIFFPVVTNGGAAIAAAYGLFAPGPHAELLIDRQGSIRAISRGDAPSAPLAAAVRSEVETLNQGKSPPPFPDDHVHQ